MSHKSYRNRNLIKEFSLARPVPHIRLSTPNENQAYYTQLSLLFAYNGQFVSPLNNQHQLPSRKLPSQTAPSPQVEDKYLS